jgi:hypothetical protein
MRARGISAAPRRLPERDRGKQFNTSVGAVVGHFAMWAVRLSPYTSPDDLGLVLEALKQKLVCHVAMATPEADKELFVKFEWMNISERQLEDVLVDALFRVPEFLRWNDRRNGNPAPLGIRTAYDDPSQRDPDDEFIDLYALVGQVARSVAVEADYDR